MKEPKYYLAVLGDPGSPGRDAVESGKYCLGSRGSRIGGDIACERGDILMLYCAPGYAEHPTSVPGIGIVLTRFNEYVFYRYLPLSTPISKDRIDRHFVEEDKTKLANVRSDSPVMFEISRQSFRDTVGATPLSWP